MIAGVIVDAVALSTIGTVRSELTSVIDDGFVVPR
jgi:hypothetical protein